MKTVLIGACLAFLGACAALPPTIDDAVSEAAQLVRAPAAEQKAALASAQEAFAAAPTPFNRVRLATLLATVPAPMRDDARAAELLRALDGAGPRTTRFANLLAAQIAERQRLAREVEKLSREVERMGKEQAASEKERQAVEKERLAADKERDKREEALRQQLEALRAIERGILEREERLRKKPEPKG